MSTFEANVCNFHLPKICCSATFMQEKSVCYVFTHLSVTVITVRHNGHSDMSHHLRVIIERGTSCYPEANLLLLSTFTLGHEPNTKSCFTLLGPSGCILSHRVFHFMTRNVLCHMTYMNSMKLVIPLHFIYWKTKFLILAGSAFSPNTIRAGNQLHSLYWSIHTKDESKRETAFAFISSLVWIDSGVVVSQHCLEKLNVTEWWFSWNSCIVV